MPKLSEVKAEDQQTLSDGIRGSPMRLLGFWRLFKAFKGWHVALALSLLGFVLTSSVKALHENDRSLSSGVQRTVDPNRATLSRYMDVVDSGNSLEGNSTCIEILGGVTQQAHVVKADMGILVLPTGCYTKVPVTRNEMISIGVDEATRCEVMPQRMHQGTACAPASQIYLSAQMLSGIFDKAINQNGMAEADGFEMCNGVVELVSGDALKSDGHAGSILSTMTLSPPSSVPASAATFPRAVKDSRRQDTR